MNNRTRSSIAIAIACSVLGCAVMAGSALASAGQVWGHKDSASAGEWYVAGSLLKSGVKESVKPSIGEYEGAKTLNFSWHFSESLTTFRWSCSGIQNRSAESTTYLLNPGKASANLVLTGCKVIAPAGCEVRTSGEPAGQLVLQPFEVALNGTTQVYLPVKIGLSITKSPTIGCTLTGTYTLSGNLPAEISKSGVELKQQPFTINAPGGLKMSGSGTGKVDVTGRMLWELG